MLPIYAAVLEFFFLNCFAKFVLNRTKALALFFPTQGLFSFRVFIYLRIEYGIL